MGWGGGECKLTCSVLGCMSEELLIEKYFDRDWVEFYYYGIVMLNISGFSLIGLNRTPCYLFTKRGKGFRDRVKLTGLALRLFPGFWACYGVHNNAYQCVILPKQPCSQNSAIGLRSSADFTCDAMLGGSRGFHRINLIIVTAWVTMARQ